MDESSDAPHAGISRRVFRCKRLQTVGRKGACLRARRDRSRRKRHEFAQASASAPGCQSEDRREPDDTALNQRTGGTGDPLSGICKVIDSAGPSGPTLAAILSPVFNFPEAP